MKKRGFHNRLRELRQARRLTQKETAKLVGVPQSSYRQWEYGQAITGEPYPQLAKAFNISLDTLFNIETNEKNLERDLDLIVSIVQNIKSKL